MTGLSSNPSCSRVRGTFCRPCDVLQISCLRLYWPGRILTVCLKLHLSGVILHPPLCSLNLKWWRVWCWVFLFFYLKVPALDEENRLFLKSQPEKSILPKCNLSLLFTIISDLLYQLSL